MPIPHKARAALALPRTQLLRETFFFKKNPNCSLFVPLSICPQQLWELGKQQCSTTATTPAQLSDTEIQSHLNFSLFLWFFSLSPHAPPDKKLEGLSEGDNVGIKHSQE